MREISEIKSKVQNIHSNYENSKRNITLDILKGFAIFCVVWGHFIQQGTLLSGIDCFNNPLEQFIYSFHMPLFMIISGYLMYQSINKRSIIQQWIHWCKNLVLPLVAWTILANLFICIYQLMSAGTLNLASLHYNQYWFIFSLLACGIIATLIKAIFKNSSVIFLLSGGIIFLTTINIFNIGWMFPFFIVGYLLNKHSDKINSKLNTGVLVCLICFPILIMFYNTSSFSYLSLMGISDFIRGFMFQIPTEEWIIAITHNIYKILTGFAGCGFMYGIAKMMQKLNLHTLTAALAWFGTYSLVIYFIQRIIIEILFGRYLFASNIWIYDFVFTLSLAIIATLLFAWFGTCIKKNKILNTILCGGR